MPAISYQAGAQRDAALEDEIRAGVRAVNADHTRVIVTRDMDGAVRALRPGWSWGADRGFGATHAKTFSDPPATILLNLPAVEAMGAGRGQVERLIAHESCHVLMNDRRESLSEHHDLCETQVAFDLTSMAFEFIEEWRCELSVVRTLNYPVMSNHELADLAWVMEAHNREVVGIISAPDSQKVGVLKSRLTGVVKQRLKYLAVAAAGAQEVDGDLHSVGRKSCPRDWADYIPPWWRPFATVLRETPPALEPWSAQGFRSALQDGAAVAREAMRQVGFDYRAVRQPGLDAFRLHATVSDRRWSERRSHAEG